MAGLLVIAAIALVAACAPTATPVPPTTVPTTAPEPTTAWLLGFGVLAMAKTIVSGSLSFPFAQESAAFALEIG